jgi:20S proteasome subunit beta 1
MVSLRLRLHHQAVADIVHYHAQFYAAQHDSRPPVHTIASLFQSLCYENKDRLSAGIIVAGWDEEQGGQVYNIPLGGGIFRQPWSIGGQYCP